MKCFLSRSLVFAFFCVLAYPVWLFAWGMSPLSELSSNLKDCRGGVGHMYSRLKEAKTVSGVDILFLGSSHAYRGFDPRIFEAHGYSSFNLGSSAQTPLQTELLVNRYLKPINPKLVIYEVYPATFASDGVESSADILSNDDIGSDSWALVRKQHHLMVYNTALFSAIRSGVMKTEGFDEKQQRPDGCYIKGGYVEMPKKNFDSGGIETKYWNFRADQFDAFSRSLELIRNQGVRVVLVMAPITRELYSSCLNMDEFNTRMHTFGTYWDFNETVSWNGSNYFYDESHLNQQGVEVFNQHLIRRLVSDGGLK